jgi:hypothetical protein
MQRDQREGDVRHQQQDAGDAQQAGARRAGPGAGEQPGQQREQHRVHCRIRRADDPFERGGGGVRRDGMQHEDPEHQSEAGGDDRRVDQAGEVAAAPGANQQRETDDQHRVRAEVERVGR